MTIRYFPTSNLAIWCDQCDDWVTEFQPSGLEILCANCENRLLIELPQKTQKQVRISLAKAIWGL